MAENRIPLKTDDSYFEKHDFVQTECGTMKELTVTITLAEYRYLLCSRARLEGIHFASGEEWKKENPDA